MLDINKITNPSQGKEKLLIELYVKLFGENYREHITKQINNTTFIWTYSNLCDALYDNLRLQKNKIENEALNEFGYFGEEEVEDIFCQLSHLEFYLRNNKPKIINNYFCDQPIRAILNVDDNFPNMSQEEQLMYIQENNNKLLSRLKYINQTWNSKYKPQIEEMKLEYLAYINDNSLKSSYDIDEEFKQKKLKLFNNYFFQKNPDLTEANLKFLHLVFESLLVGKNKIANQETEVFKQNFIGVCNLLGLDFGDDFNDYLTDEVFDYIFEPAIYEEWKQIEKEKKLEILKNSSLPKNLEQIQKLDIDGSNARLVYNLYDFIYNNETASAYCAPYLTPDGELKSICVCPINVSNSTFLHEVAHIVQFRKLLQNESFCYYKCGLSVNLMGIYFQENITTLQQLIDFSENPELWYSDEELDDFVDSSEAQTCRQINHLDAIMLNEILNEIICLMALQTAKEHNIDFVFNYKDPSLYLSLVPAINPILNNFKQQLINCSISENPALIIDFLGKYDACMLCYDINKIFESNNFLETQSKVKELAKEQNIDVITLAKNPPKDINVFEESLLEKYLELYNLSSSIQLKLTPEKSK